MSSPNPAFNLSQSLAAHKNFYNILLPLQHEFEHLRSVMPWAHRHPARKELQKSVPVKDKQTLNKIKAITIQFHHSYQCKEPGTLWCKTALLYLSKVMTPIIIYCLVIAALLQTVGLILLWLTRYGTISSSLKTKLITRLNKNSQTLLTHSK